MMSNLRLELKNAAPDKFAPSNGTAYLMVYEAVKTKHGLIHGHIHKHGESCAIGSYFDVNPNLAFKSELIDEIAAVNDSVPTHTPRQRRLHVLRWLRWRLTELGMSVPGVKRLPITKKKAKARV